jgi:hypothetical protein
MSSGRLGFDVPRARILWTRLTGSDSLLGSNRVQALEQIEKAVWNRLRSQLLVHGPKVLADVVLNVRADLSLSRVWLGPGSWRMS